MKITIPVEILVAISGGIISVVGVLIAMAKNSTKTVNRIDILEDQMKNVHVDCPFPEMRKDIKQLQKKDNDRSIQLAQIETTLSQINSMTTEIYGHFFNEGINSGRRSGD